METSVNNKCKAFTSLEQSKKLSEILPLESADMAYIASTTDDDGETLYTAEYKSEIIIYEADDYINCWSLAALLDVLPDSIYDNTDEFSQLEFTKKSVAYIQGTTDGIKIGALKDNLVDACYEMIIKLYEQKLL